MQEWKSKLQKINPPVKWLIGFIIILLSLAFLFAPDASPAPKLGKVSFKTTSDARIYFHNLRSFYYSIDATSKKPMQIYSLRRRQKNLDSLSLQFDIIQNPGSNQAFIYSALGTGFEHIDSAFVTVEKSKESTYYSNLRATDHYKLARLVYKALEENRKVYLMSAKDTVVNLYNSEQSAINAEITLEDYFKLIYKN
jgi:hypothetical protein